MVHTSGCNPDKYNNHKRITSWGWEEIENSWSFPNCEGKSTMLYVYANADEVEIIINGTTLGKKVVGTKRPYEAEYEVIYESGIIECISYKNGVKTYKSTLYTSKEAHSIKLTVDRDEIKGNAQEIAYITCEIVDKHGGIVPYANHTIHIEVLGDGELQGAANGDACATNNYQSNVLNVYKGKAIAIVRGHKTGEIRIKVKTNSLESRECLINVT